MATIIVFLDNTRKLNSQAYHIDHHSSNKHTVVNGKFSHTSIDLIHGLPFALNCDNEQSHNVLV